MWQKAWRTIKMLTAAMIFCAVCGCVGLCKDNFLLAEAHGATVRWEYALYEKNSWATLRTQVEIWELPFVEGRSVTICFSNEVGADEYIEVLLDRTGACVIAKEYCGDTENMYAYTPKLGQGIVFPQGCVNLHVAQRKNTVCVGSPIIFGGY